MFRDWNALCPAGRAGQVKGSWSPDEDEILLDAVAGQTNISWDVVATKLKSHTAKQCRERWLVKLNPDVRRSPFEEWEDDLIRSERLRIGNHWSVIAQLLPGRTACSVKNRFYTVLRYQQPSAFLIPGVKIAPKSSVPSGIRPKAPAQAFV
jgi:hypothetical protein